MQLKPSSGFTYGRSSDFHYAVAFGGTRISGVWGACEVDGELYRIVDFDEIPEDDWDRIEELEKRVTQRRKGQT